MRYILPGNLATGSLLSSESLLSLSVVGGAAAGIERFDFLVHTCTIGNAITMQFFTIVNV